MPRTEVKPIPVEMKKGTRPGTGGSDRRGDWRWQLAARFRTLDEIPPFIALDRNETEALKAVLAAYPLAVTPYYASLIEADSPADPIRRQCIPDIREIQEDPQVSEDPLGEGDHSPVPGLIHRYSDRCLVLVTNVCPVLCRHCNRKRLWRRRARVLTAARLRQITSYIAARSGIREVILSGGDPLTLPDESLARLLHAFQEIPHVEVIRIGSRAPVTLPMRVTEDLCNLLRRFRPLWFNTQFNHPRELTPEAAQACERLVSVGIPVSNQSVLLKGVNDDIETMRDLLYGLQRLSVRPYYLFHPEPVKGTGHFRVEIEKGVRMMERLRREISGLCLPRYVLDTPGALGKIPINGGARSTTCDFL